MLRCHSVPDCSSPSSHRRGHPCRKTFGIFACFPSLHLLMQKHIMNSGQKFCLESDFSISQFLEFVGSFLLCTLHCMVCTSMPFQSLTWQNPASAWCLPCVATNLRNKPTQQQTNSTKNSATELRNSPAGAHQMAMFTLPTKAGTSHLASPVGWVFQFGVRWIRLLLNEEGSKKMMGFW